jgi:hypothetical protein
MNNQTSCLGNRVVRAAISTVLILGTLSLPTRGAPRSGSFDLRAAEQAPQAKAAVDGVLDLFKVKPVVALGDYHGLAQEEAFYSVLVRDPRFGEQVGNVVVEFGGSAAQDVIDRYTNGEDVPFTELRHVWTDVIGWLPGPFALGFVNFYATVRAVNMKLPPERRIKVWLGDPKIDWTKMNSFKDVQPILARRDENIAGIIVDEILKKQKKTLLIIGGGHLVGMDFGSGPTPSPLVAEVTKDAPNGVAVVTPFTGYIEPECNAKVVARAKDWPVPSVARPIDGTWLKSELRLSGCNYVPPEQIEQMKKQGGNFKWLGPGKPPDPIAMQVNMRSGAYSDAILYLGPPDTLTVSPWEPSIYLDADYFKEMNRRAQCCVPVSYSLNLDNILEQNMVPRQLEKW